MTKISAVIFDYGNVLCLPPDPLDCQRMRSLAGFDEEATFNRMYWVNRDAYDRAAIDGQRYWQGIGEGLGKQFSAEQIDALTAQDVALWARANPVVLGWARTLQESGMKTAILSNMPSNLSGYLRQSPEWLQHFDYVVFSCEVGLLKPEPAIYHACLEGLRSMPEETLFIDDKPANVEGALAVGIHALLFQSAEQLGDDMQAFGLPCSLGSNRA